MYERKHIEWTKTKEKLSWYRKKIENVANKNTWEGKDTEDTVIKTNLWWKIRTNFYHWIKIIFFFLSFLCECKEKWRYWI